MICPTCNGKKVILGLFPIKATDTGLPELNPARNFPCFHCKGTGVVDDHTPQWIKDGAKLRETRVSLGVVLRDACKRLNIEASVLAAMESGWIEPDLTLLKKYSLLFS